MKLMLWPFKKKNRTVNEQIKSIFSRIEKTFEVMEIFDEKGVNIYTYSKSISIDPESIPILLNILEQSQKLVKNYISSNSNRISSKISSIRLHNESFTLWIIHSRKYYLIAVSSYESGKNLNVEIKLQKNLQKLEKLKLIEKY